MLIKRVLIFAPLALILFLIQSFFWVPTYDKQAVGNPKRLIKYINGAAGDAQILNPTLSADTASSEINGLVFDGLLDLDDRLKLRGRLATSWEQYEEAYLSLDPFASAPRDGESVLLRTPQDWLQFINASLADNAIWMDNIRSIEIIPGVQEKGEMTTQVLDPEGKPVTENDRLKTQQVAYVLNRPDRLKFTLKKIDQDFFDPIQKVVGSEYFATFPYGKYIKSADPSQQELLEGHYGAILPVREHNPVIVFDLRKGVRFHDGHEFDSGDVLFTYQAIMNVKNASPRRSDYEPVKSAEILGSHQIKFTYKRLFSPAINAWTMGIIPEHLLNDRAMKREAESRNLPWETFSMRQSRSGRNPVGTGPFIFQEWKSDEIIRLKRNDDYWDGAPEYEEYVARIIPDPLTQEMEFYSGSVDNYSVLPHQVARLSKDGKYQNFSTVGFHYSYIGYNIRKPLFASAKIRTALGMAIDVEPIIKYLLYGEGERVTGPYAKITDWYDPAVKPIPYDPEGALRIFNAMGWKQNADGLLEKDGKIFEFTLITNSGNPIRKNIMTIVQDNWKKIGVTCHTQLFEWAVFLKDFVNPLKFDALILGWSMGIDPDLYQIWHSSQTKPNHLNFVGYENPEADDLIVRIRREYDRQEQLKMARQLHRVIARDQPYTFLYVRKATRLLDKKIVIVDRLADGEEKYEKIYPTRGGDIRFYFNKWRKLSAVPNFTPSG